MSPPETSRHASIHAWVDRWRAADLLDDDAAAALHGDIAATEAAEAADATGGAPVAAAAPGPARSDEPDAMDRVIVAARSLVVEALGYLGAVLTLGTLLVLADVDSWSDQALLALLVLGAAVSAWGTVTLTPAEEGPTSRLAGVLGVTAVGLTAGALYVLFDPACFEVDDCSRFQEEVLPLAVTLPTLGVAVALYLRHRHLLTHVALGGATMAAITTVALALVGESGPQEPPVLGAMMLVVALGWVVGSERGALVPAWLGTFAAGAVSYAGMSILTDTAWFGHSDSASIVAALLLAAGYAVSGTFLDRVRLTILGALGLLFTVPMLFTEVFGLSGRATAGILLPVGIVLTVWAVAAGRDDRPG